MTPLDGQNAFFRGLAAWVLRHRMLTAGFVAAITGVALWQIATRIRVDSSFEYLLGQESEVVRTLEAYKADFGRDDLHLVLVRGDVFTPEFLDRLRVLHDDLMALDVELDPPRHALPAPPPVEDPLADEFASFGPAEPVEPAVVEEVTSLINFPRTVSVGGAIQTRGLLDDPVPAEDLPALRDDVLDDPVMVGTVVDAEGTYAVLGVRTRLMTEDESKQVNDALIEAASAHDAEGFTIEVTGLPDLVSSLSRTLVRDLGRLTGLAFLVMAITMWVMFRHPLGVLGPMLSLVIAAIWMVGSMAALGIPVSAVTNVLPSFLFCVGIGDSVHIQSVYRVIRERGVPHHEAIVETLGSTAMPILFTVTTTAGGLFAFWTARTGALQEFGTAGGLGVAYAMIVTILVIPVVLSFDHKGGFPKVEEGSRITWLVNAMTAWSATPRGRWIVLGTLAAALAASALGISQIRVYHNALTWLSPSHHSRVALEEMDREVGGVGVVHVVLERHGADGVTSLPLLQAVEGLEEDVRAWRHPLTGEPVVTNVTSVVEVLRETQQALHDGDPAAWRLPDTQAGVAQSLLLFESADPQALRRLLTADLERTHVTFRLRWMDATSYVPFTDFLEERLAARVGDLADVRVTGTVHNTVHVMGLLVGDMLRSFFSSFLIVAALMFFVLRDIRLGLIAMAPALVPVALVLGAMGFVGVPIDVSNLVIASIVIGVCDDDTIHYLYQFKLGREAGLSSDGAIRYALGHSGHSIVTMSVTLLVGFSVFAASEMANIRRFGLLVDTSVVFAGMVTLAVTPALVRVVFRSARARAAAAVAAAALLVPLVLARPAWALDASTGDPRAVMEAVEARDTGDHMLAKLDITITDAGGRERHRAVQVRAMDVETGRKQLVLFEDPADVRGTGFLSIEWDDASRPDDQWLYLPSLARTTRIAGADKSASFMGTDLTYADMSVRDPDAYDFVMVDANAVVDGEPCWLVDQTPRTDEERAETGYSRSQVWVSKDRLMPVQIKSWLVDGRQLKYTRFLDVRSIGGVWFAHRVVVRTVENGKAVSTSVLSFPSVAFGDPSVTEEEFTERRMEQGP